MNEIALVKSEVKIENWSEMIRARKASGLTVRQWCSENRISIKTYYYRLKKVRQAALARVGQESSRDTQPVFGKLQFSPKQIQMAAVTVHLPYATLEIAESASERTIAAVLSALKSTC